MERNKYKRRAWKWDVGLCVSGELRKQKAKCDRKENERESAEAKQRFEKEAAILSTIKGHRNVCQFLKFCQEPYAIMMEYSCFDFNFLEVDKKVSSLEDFIHFIDAEFEFESFSDVLLLGARDVVTGLDYLHSHNIAHRDLKVGNTLVSNQNHITMDGGWAKVYAECPTVCKLTDFGLQTCRQPHSCRRGLNQSKTWSDRRRRTRHEEMFIHYCAELSHH